VKQAKVRLLVRTYAQAVAGTPLVMRFRPGSGRFWFRYRPDRSITAPTRIFVSPLHYPHGFEVAVEHGSYRRAGRYLLVRANSTRTVSVLITRSRAQQTHR
jgi:endoglycosylceramidase